MRPERGSVFLKANIYLTICSKYFAKTSQKSSVLSLQEVRIMWSFEGAFINIIESHMAKYKRRAADSTYQ